MFLLLLACRVVAPVDSAEPVPWSSPDAWGPYGAGVDTVTYVDVRGKAQTMEVWFPAIVDPNEEPDEYPELPWSMNSHRRVDPDKRGAPYPLIAFSHGNGGVRYQSAYLMEHLASHGYVVASVDHVHNTLLDLDDDYMLEVFLDRPGDIIHMVDEVYAMEEEGVDELAGMIDPDAGYVMMGHSFGAWTSLVVGGGEVELSGITEYCEGRGGIACRFLSMVEVDDPTDPAYALPSDPRVLATMPMSPGVWYSFGDTGEGLSGVTKPFLLAGEADDILAYETEAVPVYEQLSAPKRMATFVGGGHYAFTDICLVAAAFFDDCAGPSEGWIDLEVAHQLSKTIVTSWLGEQLKQDADYSPWLGEEYAAENPELYWSVDEP